jgi:hypothetical protein
MKKLILFALLILCTPVVIKAQCDTSLWRHVYKPERLQVQRWCISVSGTIVSKPPEGDGDVHIRVQLDPQFQNLLNEKNMTEQGGNLVVEPMCLKRVTQASAMRACRGWKQRITIPAVGSRVVVTGDYALDTEHGWMEIHPVTIIRVVRPPRQRPR